jgi:3-oxoacyl-[acyl-carrier-protein] synthase-3
MSFTSPYRTRIAATGSFLPERRLSNQDLEKMVDTNDQWIRERTGIRWRRMAEDGVNTSDLAFEASKIALKEANVKPTDLDMILVATASPDTYMPNTACLLQQKLGGAGRCAAFDVSAACSGLVYGFSIADQFIKNGTYQNVLLVGAEILHRFVNYKDRETCILFGDAAGAMVLTRAPEDTDSKVYSSHLHADGDISHLFELPAGGTAMPITQHVVDEGLHFVRMKGREIFKHAVRTMSSACEEALESNKMTPDDVSWIIPHQANLRIIEAVAKHFGIGMDRVIVEIEDTGNTSAATIVVALDRAIRDGRIKRGQNIMLTAFGAGITSGSLFLRY